MKLKLLCLPWYHIDPNRGELYGEREFPPLGVATLTAFLKKHGICVEQDDLDVKVAYHNEKFKNSNRSIKLHFFNDERKIAQINKEGEEILEKEGEKILGLTNCKDFDVIGFSLHSTDNPSVIGVALTVAKLLKEKYGSTIITGSLMDNLALRKLLKSHLIDCAIFSSHVGSFGETNLLKFCNMYEKGMDIQKIPGTISMQGEKLIHKYGFEDYEKNEKCIFTLPEFSGLPMDLYIKDVSSKIEDNSYSSKILILPYFFIYGCLSKCAFCWYSKYPLVGMKKPEEIVEDLEILSKKYHTRYFYFLNTEINPTKEYSKAVANELIKRDINILWTDCATFKNMDIGLLKKLRESGAARLVWGLESASQRMLDYIQKGVRLNEAKTCLKKSRKLGIWNQVLFICGFPYEKEGDINFTLSFLKKNQKYIHETVLNKFWIDGLFEDYPKKFGIQIKKSTKIYRNWSTKPFDEINGLCWEDKAKQNLKLYDKLSNFLIRLKIFNAMPIPIVFHLINLQRELGVKFETDTLEYTKDVDVHSSYIIKNGTNEI